MKIELKKITAKNHTAVCKLSVTNEQKAMGIIAENADSLKTAKSEKSARPFAIYADETLVGFAMFAFPNEEVGGSKYWLWRFMIDQHYQHQGYGTESLKAIIAYFKNQKADNITLQTEPENKRAIRLYHKLGFNETGEMAEKEELLRLEL